MIRVLVNDDQALVAEYLERNHIETTFLYGNITQFGLNNNRLYRRCGDYYGYFDGPVLQGILAFYNLGSVIPHFETDKAIPHFAALMRRRNFDSLLGMRRIIQPLYELLLEDKDKEVVNYSESGYYLNQEFHPHFVEKSEFVDVEKMEPAAASRFIVRANRHGFKRDVSSEVHKIIRERAPEEEFVLMKINGKIVGQAQVQTFTTRINQIGAVYTVEEERGRGYCKALVSELCRRILERDKIPALMVRNDNLPAVRAYTALGFARYDDYLLVGVKPAGKEEVGENERERTK
ncbi:MAG TPA: GNAT family N-acetyltransferase [Patescibacteria group bacterium]|nr:GNAT family N-acetyltransferase [Patescibacteria group bacterium]